MNIDQTLFYRINGWAGKYPWLDLLAAFCARWLGYMLVICLTLFSLVAGNISMLIFPVLAGFIARFAINEPIYFFWQRKRPPQTVPTTLLIPQPLHPSFPSSHAGFFFAFSCTLLLFNVPLAIIFLIISCIVVFFRIFCGVHWPLDILAGILSGIISFLITWGLLILL